MGPMFEGFTLDAWLDEMRSLLLLIAHWLLESGMGPTVLVLILVMLVLWAVAIIHNNVKMDDRDLHLRDDYWR